MSKIFIKKPKYPLAFDGINFLVEIVLLIILLGSGFYITFYPLLAYLILLAIYMLISYLLFRRYPEGTLYTKDNTLYYYHLAKLTTISFNDINSVEQDEKKEDIFRINYNVNNETKELKIKNYEAQMLTIELNKTIHKALSKQNKKH